MRVSFQFPLTSWKVPGIVSADIDVWNDSGRQGAGEDLAFEVLKNKLFIGWLETETRRQSHHSILSNKLQPPLRHYEL